MVNFGRAIGGLTGGLAQGIQAGQEMAFRKQAMDMQKQQAELQKTQAFIEIMQIEDPVVQEYAMNSMLPTMGIDPKGDQYKNLTKMTKLKAEAKDLFTQYIVKQVEGGEELAQIFKNMGNPEYAMKMLGGMQQMQLAKRQDVREEAQLGIQQQELGLSRQRVGIAATEAATSRTQAETAAARQAEQDARQLAKDTQESFDKGLTLMDAAGSIADHDARLARVQIIASGHPELGLTPEGMEAWAANPGMTYEQLKQATEAQTAIDVAPLALPKARADLARSEAETTTARAKALTAGEQAQADLSKAKADAEAAALNVAYLPQKQQAEFKKLQADLAKTEKEIKGDPTPEQTAHIEQLKAQTAALVSGATAPLVTQKRWLSLRAQNKTSSDMPSNFKSMDPATAKQGLVDLKTGPLVQVGPSGEAVTGSQRGTLTMAIADIEGTQQLATQLIDTIERSPETAGMLGTGVAMAQNVVGAANSFLDFLPKEDQASLKKQATDSIGADLSYVTDTDTKLHLGEMLTNPDIPVTEVLESALALRYARSLDVSTRVNADQFRTATKAVRVRGLFGKDQAIARIKAIRDRVLEPTKNEKKRILKNLPAGGEELAVPDTTVDDLTSTLDDMGLGEEQ